MRSKKVLSAICALAMLVTVPTGQAVLSTDAVNAEVGDVRVVGGHKIIEADSGQTLTEVFETLRQQDFETACAFDQQGNKLLDVTSNLAQQVYTSSKQREAFAEQGGVLFLHNHPSDGSFGWFHEHALREILTENPEAKNLSVTISTWVTHQTMLDVATEFRMKYYRYEASEFDFKDPRIFQLPNSGCALE